MAARLHNALMCLCTLVLVVQVKLQTTPITLDIVEASPIVKSPRSTVNISCSVNVGLNIILTHDIEWLKESRVIASVGRIVYADQPNYYGLNLIHNQTSLSSMLTINSAKEEDSGRYTCQLKRKQGGVEANESVDLIVADVALEMYIDNRTITASTKVFPAKQYTVDCTARASNSQPQVALFLDNNQLQGNPVNNNAMGPEVKAVIQVSKADTGKRLSCRTQSDQYETSTVLTVVDETRVSCADVTAGENATHVQLCCVIDHPGVEVVDTVWELENTGINYSNDMPPNTPQFTTEILSDTKRKESLNLYVVTWGETRTMTFTLTAITEAGDVSDQASLKVVPEGDQITDNDGDDSNDPDDVNGDDTNSGQSRFPLVTIVVQSLVVVTSVLLVHM